VSHELRSPLARLQVAAGLLQRPGTDAQDTLRRIEREVERLDRLVDEVLTLARLESGTPPGTPGDIDAIGLLESVAEDARFEARSKGRDLRFDSSLRSITLRAHGELLLRAFENVIRNAVKFTAEGSCVDVRAEVDARMLRVSVADRGPGLPAGALQRIFEPFVRVEGGTHTEGFGLGLAIARRAVEAHGGSIAAAARAGGGLELRFALPLAAAGAGDLYRP